jgi:hypothetical protein
MAVWAVRPVFETSELQCVLVRLSANGLLHGKLPQKHERLWFAMIGFRFTLSTSTLFVLVFVMRLATVCYSCIFRFTDRPASLHSTSKATASRARTSVNEPSTLTDPRSRSTITKSMGATYSTLLAALTSYYRSDYRVYLVFHKAILAEHTVPLQSINQLIFV